MPNCTRSSARPVPPRGRVRGCTPPTRWRPSARRSGCRCPAAASPPAVDYRREVFARESGIRGRPARARRRPASARHHDQGGVRERHRGRDGGGRFHECRAAPAGDRARSAASTCELDDFDRDRAHACRTLSTCRPAGRFVMSDLDRVGGVPVVMQGAARGRPAARRLHDGHGQDAGREPRRDRHRRTRRHDRASAVATRSTPRAGSRSCAATSRPIGAVMKAAGAEELVFAGRARPFDSETGGVRRADVRRRSCPATSS